MLGFSPKLFIRLLVLCLAGLMAGLIAGCQVAPKMKPPLVSQTKAKNYFFNWKIDHHKSNLAWLVPNQIFNADDEVWLQYKRALPAMPHIFGITVNKKGEETSTRLNPIVHDDYLIVQGAWRRLVIQHNNSQISASWAQRWLNQ